MPGSTEPLDGAVDLGERVETGASGPITEDGAISIGGIWFTANPQDINVTIEQKVKTSYVLRQAGTRVPEKIMSTVVNVNMQIGPNDYAGLVQLVRMYRMAPFVPIVNFKINGHYSVFFVALQSINVSSVEGFPQELSVSISMLKFNPLPFMPWAYDPTNVFNDELFTWFTRDYGTERFPCLDQIRQERLPKYNEKTPAMTKYFNMYGIDPQKARIYDRKSRMLFMVQAMYQAMRAYASSYNVFNSTQSRNRQKIAGLIQDYAKAIQNNKDLKTNAIAREKLIQTFMLTIASTRDRGMSQAMKNFLPEDNLPDTDDDLTFDPAGGSTASETYEHKVVRRWIEAMATMPGSKMYSVFVEGFAGNQGLDDRSAIQRMTKALEETVKDEYTTMPLAAMDLIGKAYAIFDPADEYTCLYITYSYSNNFSPILMEGDPEHTLQYMGGGESWARVVIQGHDLAVTNAIRILNDEIYLQIASPAVLGFFEVQNSLLNMLGFNYAIPLRLSSSTVPGYPQENIITFELADFDKAQGAKEMLEPIKSFYDTIAPLIGEDGSVIEAQKNKQACEDIVDSLKRLKSYHGNWASSTQQDLQRQVDIVDQKMKSLFGVDTAMQYFKNRTEFGVLSRMAKTRSTHFDLMTEEGVDGAIEWASNSVEIWKMAAGEQSTVWQPEKSFWRIDAAHRKYGALSLLVQDPEPNAGPFEGQVDLSVTEINKGLKETKEGFTDLEAYPDLMLPRYSEVLCFLLTNNAQELTDGIATSLKKNNTLVSSGVDPTIMAAQVVDVVTNGLIDVDTATGQVDRETAASKLASRSARIEGLIRSVTAKGTDKVPVLRGMLATLNDNGGAFVDPDFYVWPGNSYLGDVSLIIAGPQGGGDSGFWLADRFGHNMYMGDTNGMVMAKSSKQDAKARLKELDDLLDVLEYLDPSHYTMQAVSALLNVINGVWTEGEARGLLETYTDLVVGGQVEVLKLITTLFSGTEADLIDESIERYYRVRGTDGKGTDADPGKYEKLREIIGGPVTDPATGKEVMGSDGKPQMNPGMTQGRGDESIKIMLMSIRREIARLKLAIGQGEAMNKATKQAKDFLETGSTSALKSSISTRSMPPGIMLATIQKLSTAMDDDNGRFTRETMVNALVGGARYAGQPIDALYTAAPASAPPGFGGAMAGLLTDEVYYSGRNRLIRAFPTCRLIFINETPRAFGMKFWTDTFSYNALNSVVVRRHRDEATHTCVIELTNLYKTLQAKMFDERLDTALQQNFRDTGRIGGKAVGDMGFGQAVWSWISDVGTSIKNWGDQMIAKGAQATHHFFSDVQPEEIVSIIQARIMARFSGMYLKEGIRIQVRMGYSGNVGALKNRFVGTVVECNLGEEITLVAEGDGRELLNRMGWDPYDEPSSCSIGTESREFLVGMLAAKGELGSPPSAWAEYKNIFNRGRASEENPYGIYHFGSQTYKDAAMFDTGWAVMGAIAGGVVGSFGGQWGIAAGAVIGGLGGAALSSVERGANKTGVLELEMNMYGPNELGANNDANPQTRGFSLSHMIEDWGSSIAKLPGVGGDMNASINFQPAAAGHTFWSLSQVFADIAPDFVRAVEPFELRSSFFFGKPHWNYVCEYFYPESERVLGRLIPPGNVTMVTRIANLHQWQNTATSGQYDAMIVGGAIEMGLGIAEAIALSETLVFAIPGIIAAISGGIKLVGGLFGKVGDWVRGAEEVIYAPSGEAVINDGTRGRYGIGVDPVTLFAQNPDQMYQYFLPWERMGMVYKPYQQLHVLTSETDFIKNGIKASEREIYNKVTARTLNTFKEPDGAHRDETVHVDTDIWPEHIKEIMINSGIVGRFRTGIPILKQIGQYWVGGTAMYTMRIAASRMRDYMKRMYQGQEVLVGNPSIKPHDLQYIGDTRYNMFGLASIRSVIDVMSFEDGYINIVEPDACVITTDKQQIEVWAWCCDFGKRDYLVRQNTIERYKLATSQISRAYLAGQEIIANASAYWSQGAAMVAAGLVPAIMAKAAGKTGWFGFIDKDGHYRNPIDTYRQVIKDTDEMTESGRTLTKKMMKRRRRAQQMLSHMRRVERAYDVITLASRRLMDPDYQKAQRVALKEAEGFRNKYFSALEDIAEYVDAPTSVEKTAAIDKIKQNHPDFDWDEFHGDLSRLAERCNEMENLRVVTVTEEAERRGRKAAWKKYNDLNEPGFRKRVSDGLKERLGVKRLSTKDVYDNLHLFPESNDIIHAEALAHIEGRLEDEVESTVGNIGDDITMHGRAWQRLSKFLRASEIGFDAMDRYVALVSSGRNMGTKLSKRLMEVERLKFLTKYLKKLTPALMDVSTSLVKGLLSTAAATGIVALAESMLSFINISAAARQAVTINVLTVNGRELSAGVDGHQGCVIGDSLGVQDSIIESIGSLFSETYPDTTRFGETFVAPPAKYAMNIEPTLVQPDSVHRLGQMIDDIDNKP